MRLPQGAGDPDESTLDSAPAKNKPAREPSGRAGGNADRAEADDASPDENRMESLLEHWNIPRPDIPPGAAEPSLPPEAEGPPITAVAAGHNQKRSPGPDGLTLLFTLLVAAFLAGGGYVAYRNWSNRYQPA